MLLNDFYTYSTQEKSDELLVVRIDLNKNHNIYEGHFPSMPVTPGVCQVQMVKEILSEELGQKYNFVSARDIKFINMINPKEVGQLNLELKLTKADDGTLKVRGLMQADGKKYLKVTAVLNGELV